MTKSVKQWTGIAAIALVLVGYQFANENGDTQAAYFGTFNPDNGESVEVTPSVERNLFNLKDFNDAIADIAEKTNPTVVTVTTKQTVRRQNNPFSGFFGQPGQGQGQTRRGLGSGVIVSEDGLILTNNHVIEGADEVNIRLFEGDEIEAEVVGADPLTDIAVLRVKEDNLSFLKLGDSNDVRVGEFVLAIGSPLDRGLANTVSFGIVSAKGRSIGLINDGQNAGFEDFIQTDAAINPGNSGGALIDLDGNLIGINSAIASRSGGNDGIGFTIPINIARRIMEDLLDDGKVSRGFLGIRLKAEVDQTLAEALDLGDVRGIMIDGIQEDSPAYKGGLESDDIIVSLDGDKIKDWLSFRTKISTYRPGDQVSLGIIRDGKDRTVNVELGENNLIDEAPAEVPENDIDMEEKLGFNVTDLTNDIRRQLRLDEDTDGVVVSRISESSEAYERGLRRGSVITKVRNAEVNTPREFYKEMQKLVDSGKKVALLSVETNGSSQLVAFEF